VKIERPASGYEIVECSGFQQWWDDHIEPINKMLSDSKQRTVYMYEGNVFWDVAETHYSNRPLVKTANIINIQPIKKETAEDVLREIYKHQTDKWSYAKDEPMDELLKRARAVLGE